MSSPISGLSFGNETDEFVDILYNKPPPPKKGPHGPKPGDKSFYDRVVDGASAPWSYPIISGADALRRLYPKHSLVMTRDYEINVLNLPGVVSEPLDDAKAPLITNLTFIPLGKKADIPGILVDQIEVGSFKVSWEGYDFIVYIMTVPIANYTASQTFILHEGPEEPARFFTLAAGAWFYQLHDEIWMFDQGYWQKSAALYTEVQKANWDDVILKDDFKKALQKDVFGFFTSEQIYKDLGIPWKRGLILYGPPGNGKTISIKAIMKFCGDQGFTPLYVKSFQSWAGEEAAMSMVFNKARQLSPSVIIMEDLDSLINDSNRSFFLNQVDGLHGNDGLLMIATTNHFDRLDPGLKTRPSRFDRKYKFDDPDVESRKLYVQYWQKKLAGKPDIDFPDSLVQEIAEATSKFSFAYLKEAFVSTLVTLAGIEGQRPTFASAIKSEIAKLSKQLDKEETPDIVPIVSGGAPSRPPRPDSATERDLRAVIEAISDSPGRRVYGSQPRPKEEGRNDVGALINALEQLQTTDALFRRYDTMHERHSAPNPSTNMQRVHHPEGNSTLNDRLDTLLRQQASRFPADPFQSSSHRTYTQGYGGGQRWDAPPWQQTAPLQQGNLNGGFPVRYHPNHMESRFD